MSTIQFCSEIAEYGCFSDFSLHPVIIDNVCYKTTEHYFQSQKFTDKEYQPQIKKAAAPMAAAILGRNRKAPLRRGRESMKDDIMLRAIRAKVKQHSDVYDALLSTGNAVLVEHTSDDSYWRDGGDGSGHNRLGKILMKARDELKVTKQHEINFCLL